MVLGCYYLTVEDLTDQPPKDRPKGAGMAFSSADEAIMATGLGHAHVQAPIKVELETWDPQVATTAAGRCAPS